LPIPRKSTSLELPRQLRDDIEPTRRRGPLNSLRESSLNDVQITPRLPHDRANGKHRIAALSVAGRSRLSRYGATATDMTVWQSVPSAVPLPVHVPEHCLSAFTHLPLEQSASATQTHASRPGVHAGTGERAVVHS
jgi:hypothetical protein